MNVYIRYPSGRLARKAIDVPKLRRIRLLVGEIVDTDPSAPTVTDVVVSIATPFAIAVSLNRVVR
jgi:hypothetical protein